MYIIKNPAKSRPLSANVKRLMKMERESALNPNVKKIGRAVTARDLLYCDMQGNIFMAALDRRLSIADFAPVYMTSQLAGVIDHHFSVDGGREIDNISVFLQMPLLLKSPETMVDVVVWLNDIVAKMTPEDTANLAVVREFLNEESIHGAPAYSEIASFAEDGEEVSVDALADEYEYAYWLGYIYRYECFLHDESSRMVYGAFNETFMRKTYNQMAESLQSVSLAQCAGEICQRLDMLLVGNLWK